MAGIGDRIAKLERLLRPPERQPELISEEARRDLDALAAIVHDSGPQLADARARIEELNPELDYYHTQLAAKRIVIRAAPDGERLWTLLASATDADRKLAHVREDGF